MCDNVVVAVGHERYERHHAVVTHNVAIVLIAIQTMKTLDSNVGRSYRVRFCRRERICEMSESDELSERSTKRRCTIFCSWKYTRAEADTRSRRNISSLNR